MKKSCFILILGLFLSINYVHAEGGTIAVVDLQKIVSNSAQVKQLKQEHAKKMDELNKIIVNARGEISNETDSAKILQKNLIQKNLLLKKIIMQDLMQLKKV